MLESEFEFITKVDLPLCPDTIHLIPGGKDFLACNYFLNKDTMEKTGSLNIFSISNDVTGGLGTESKNPVLSLQKKSEKSENAVFDGKWNFSGTRNLYAIATSDAKVSVGELKTANIDGITSHELYDVASTLVSSDLDVCALYIDWIVSSSSSESDLVVSRSDGLINILKLRESSLSVDREWRAHDLFGSPIEVWVAASSPTDRSLIYSGGDDCSLKGWDLRTDCMRPLFTSSEHYGGVTTVNWHPYIDHLVATGSYDENILLWDDRNMSKPVLRYATGGGVWRLKWHPDPHYKHVLAAACMYNGAQLLNFEALRAEPHDVLTCLMNDETVNRIAHYTNHKSITYDIEWLINSKSKECIVSGEADNTRPYLVSCSFYDQDIHLWRPTRSID